MKSKILFLFLVLLSIIGITFMIIHQLRLKPSVEADQNTISDSSEPVVSEPPKNTYKPVPIDGFSLWTNEAKSLSCYQDGLDEVTVNEDRSNHYENNLLGYSFDYSSDWTIDKHAIPYYTRLFDRNFRLDITVQDVNKAWTTVDNYIAKTLSPINSLITSDKNVTKNSLNVRIVDYTRPLISGIENDLNCYSYYFIIFQNYVYTMQLKTNQSDYDARKNDVEILLDSFNAKGTQNIDLNQKIKSQENTTDLTLEHGKKTLNIPANTFMMGVYTPNSLDIMELESSIQQQFGMQLFYKSIDTNYDSYTQDLVNQNKLPVITFLYHEQSNQNSKDVVKKIIGGLYDVQLTDWATHIAELDAPVLIRLGNEMNGEWSEWCLANNYNDPDLYKLSFMHIINVFKESGASNAYFLWNPNHVSDPYFVWNDAAMFYPGDNMVDFVGMTYYNYGFSNFQSFDSLYNNVYWEYSRAYYKKPLMIGEFGSVEEGGDKAQWITQMFSDIPAKYPNIKLSTWFDAKHSPDSIYDMRIRTSQESLNAFVDGMNQPAVIKRLDDTQ